jgi:signal transduction histidine kinase
MKGKDETKRHPETLGRRFGTPVAVLFLGLLGAVLLIWTNGIDERQKQIIEWADAAMDVQVKVAMFHLLFEESITKGSNEGVEKAVSDLDEAARLTEALLHGGLSERGTNLTPLDNPLLRQHAENATLHLARLKESARKRQRDPEFSGIGSATDQDFNRILTEFQKEVRVLEVLAEDRLADQFTKEWRVHIFTLFGWIAFVAASTTGIFRRERRRWKAEEALVATYDDMERIIEVRTAELSTANRKLQAENAERQRAEASLIMSEREYKRFSAQFRTLLDTIPDSIILISPDQKVVWANKGARALFPYDPAGRRCYERWHGASAPCGDCPALRSLHSGREESSRNTSPDGRHWDVRTIPVKPEEWGIEGVIELASDVTDRVVLQAEAIRAGHLASIGELAAGVAHEINSPINGIINYAQILCNKSDPGSPERDISGRILKEGDRIADIVRGLLSFARDREEKKRPVSIEEILSESLLLTRAQTKKEGIGLQTIMPSGLPEIVANPQQIQQVFMNLISNARHALNEKYPGAHADKVLEIRGERVVVEGGDRVLLTFRDTGTGIPAELIRKVVEPFFSTKPIGQGTGLGLSICSGIVKDHGGTLGIESVEGEFTSITVDLPARA